MSQSAMLWKRVLARHPELEEALSANSAEINIEDSKPVGNDDLSDDQGLDDLFADFNDNPFDAGNDAPSDELDDQFANFNADFEIEDPDPTINDERNDAPANADALMPVVDRTFEDSADLWLTQSRIGLDHALLAMGIDFSEIRPTKRPLLIFGSPRPDLKAPEYHRVEVKREGWPCHLHSTERLTVNATAEILASSKNEASLTESPPYFEGETVAVEVPNPLLAGDRWIVIWPILDSLPEWAREDSTPEAAECHQWKCVRRVVWCVNREQIGPRDVCEWLARFWRDTSIRIALFQAASFANDKEDEATQSRVLPRIRRTLEKFDGIKGHPWIVVGP